MSRPGFVLTVDERTSDLLTLSGSRVQLQRFPTGTQVVYPPDPMPSSDPVPLIDSCLASPVGASPLATQLRPGMKLTVVVGSVHPVQPRMRFDVRRSMVERVLEQAARAGVDDVALVIAAGLSPRWSAKDVVAALGDRVAASFLPDGLIHSHDVTSSELVEITRVEGQPVLVDPRIAESDLVVVVDVCHGRRGGCVLATGATDIATINRIAGLGGSAEAVAQVSQAIGERIEVFAISAVLGQPFLGQALSFLNEREWEWRLPHQLAFAAARQLVELMPVRGAHRLHASPRADRQVLDVVAGAPDEVIRQASAVWQAANAVLVTSSDTVITSVWGSSIDPGDPVGSPISAAHHALVDRVGNHGATPLVRDGGVVIAFHPLLRLFSNRLQSSSADFFDKVLPQTRDAQEIHRRFEPQALGEDWHLRLYRDHHAHHPLAVFHSWYAIQEATSRLSEVIWVGGSRESAAVLGHRAATTLADALELARDHGGSGTITYLHGPGRATGACR
ncbi:MAG: lactate racemase domain-containing protein [Propionibacteriaceae bacterium]|nr:lactate racemase domain-containing protein [Propionibacteriaceae bacterium]